MSAIENLFGLAPPPAQPKGINFVWPDVELLLGCSLPKDFKDTVTCYGSGVFQPSAIQLCNYLDRNFNYCDHLLIAARNILGDDAPQPLFPNVDGLLPFASQGVDTVFLWNPAVNPWQVICVSETTDAIPVVVPNITTIDFLLCFFKVAATWPDDSIESALQLPELPTIPQSFQPIEHDEPIDHSVAIPIALGGGLRVFRIVNRLSIAVPVAYVLSRAVKPSRNRTNWEVDWAWRPPHVPSNDRPAGSVRLSVQPPSQNTRTPLEEWNLFRANYVSYSWREHSVSETAFGPMYRVAAANGDISESGVTCHIHYLAVTAGLFWKLDCLCDSEIYEQVNSDALRAAQSIRAVVA